MRLAFVVMDAGQGGHTRTAVTIGAALRERGHDVRFIIGVTSADDLVREQGFDIKALRTSRIGHVHGLTDCLRAFKTDAVHAFNRQGLTSTLRACRRLVLPFYWTICGGTPPRGVPVGGHIVSLSHEIADDLIRRRVTDDAHVTVEPARLDLRAMTAAIHSATPRAHAAFRRAHGIAPQTKIVLRVCRLARAYMASISQTAEAVAELAAEGLDVTFVHVGYVSAGGQPVQHRISQEFQQLNTLAGRTVAITTDSIASAPLPYLSIADAAVGTGRTAFEAMLAEVPTIVVGVGGFAGAATMENAIELLHFNFSGRNVAAPLGRRTSVIAIREHLRPLLLRGMDGQRWLGPEWVRSRLDVGRAATTYEKLYSFPPGPLPPVYDLLRYDGRTLVERAERRVMARMSTEWLPSSARLPN